MQLSPKHTKLAVCKLLQVWWTVPRAYEFNRTQYVLVNTERYQKETFSSGGPMGEIGKQMLFCAAAGYTLYRST